MLDYIPNGAVELALDLAQIAGAKIKAAFCSGVETRWKADGSPVTATDIEINKLVIDRIAEVFPTHGFIGEELGNETINKDYVWVCDPIDGTRAFVLGLPLSTFMLALTHEGKPILAAVSSPFTDQVYLAQVGLGASVNGRTIHLSTEPSISNSNIDVRTNHKHAYVVPGLHDTLMDAGANVMEHGAVGITGCLVAGGRLAASIWSGDSPWDAAALKPLIEEAGGRFTDLAGNDQRYDRPVYGFIASNGVVHDELVGIVQRCGVQSTKS